MSWSKCESLRIAMGVGETWGLLSSANDVVCGNPLKKEKEVSTWLKENSENMQKELGVNKEEIDDILPEELQEAFYGKILMLI